MRQAGDLIEAFLREGKLADNRSAPIGGGAYGVVFDSDIEGNVMKQGLPGGFENDFIQEANLQAIAADMGIAPRVAGVETFRGGVGDRLEMQDIRRNFEPVSTDGKSLWPSDPRVNLQTAQQVGALALKGVRLDDRKADNMVQNRMTGRPMQLDFGIAERVEGVDQVMALADATEDGFIAAGIGDIGQIFRDTVYDLISGGQVDDAMDVAKQGFSRLQKIRL
jgi:hypothetical protein